MEQLTVHHLIPRQAVKRKKAAPGPIVEICTACHRQIHNLFNNTELAKNLHTLEKLKQDPQLGKFLVWMRKQSPDKRIRVNRHKQEKR